MEESLQKGVVSFQNGQTERVMGRDRGSLYVLEKNVRRVSVMCGKKRKRVLAGKIVKF